MSKMTSKNPPHSDDADVIVTYVLDSDPKKPCKCSDPANAKSSSMSSSYLKKVLLLFLVSCLCVAAYQQGRRRMANQMIQSSLSKTTTTYDTHLPVSPTEEGSLLLKALMPTSRPLQQIPSLDDSPKLRQHILHGWIMYNYWRDRQMESRVGGVVVGTDEEEDDWDDVKNVIPDFIISSVGDDPSDVDVDPSDVVDYLKEVDADSREDVPDQDVDAECKEKEDDIWNIDDVVIDVKETTPPSPTKSTRFTPTTSTTGTVDRLSAPGVAQPELDTDDNSYSGSGSLDDYERDWEMVQMDDYLSTDLFLS